MRRKYARKDLHPALALTLDAIPAAGQTWTRAERDLFVATFGNLLDLFHPPVDDPPQNRGGPVTASDGSGPSPQPLESPEGCPDVDGPT